MFGIDSELEAQFNAKYLDLLGAYRGKEQTSPELPGTPALLMMRKERIR
jgi:hypothetical protein